MIQLQCATVFEVFCLTKPDNITASSPTSKRSDWLLCFSNLGRAADEGDTKPQNR